MYRVPITGVPRKSWACLRELRGSDEQVVVNADTASAIALVDRLLIAQCEQDLAPGHANDLPAADRDSVLAVLYERTFGPRIAGVQQCTHCNAQFDMDFRIADISVQAEDQRSNGEFSPDADGTYRLPTGGRFRLPTGKDEMALINVSPEEASRKLLARCLIEGDAEELSEPVQAAMAQLSPMSDMNLSAACPECSKEQTLHFNIQLYLLSAIVNERSRLAYEIHVLARAYGWSLREILDLTRADRLALVGLIQAELAA